MKDTLDLDKMRHNQQGYYYLASPFSKYPDGLEAAFQDVCRAAAWLTERGVYVYCPIAMTHPIAKYGGIDPANHEIWIPADRPLMHGAAGLIVCMMPTWEESYGIGLEIDEFIELDRVTYYMEWDPEQPNGGRGDAR